MRIKQYPIHHFFPIFKSPYLFWIEWGSNQYSIHRFQQVSKVQINFELNEETASHPFISSFVIIMDMINNSTWPFNRSEVIHELDHLIWSCNHYQLIGSQSMLIKSVIIQVHCRILGTTLFPSISKINLRLVLPHFQLIRWRQVWALRHRAGLSYRFFQKNCE